MTKPRLKQPPSRLKVAGSKLKAATSTAQRTRGSAWMAITHKVKTRDQGMCQACKRAGRARPGQHVDHIHRRELGGSDDLSNLQYLCIPCHKAKSTAEQQYGA
jgi:5-methylcytosine-specific restriction protein A